MFASDSVLRFRFVAQIQSSELRFTAQIQSSAHIRRNKFEAVDAIEAPHDAVEESKDGPSIQDAGVVNGHGLAARPPPRRRDQVEPTVAAGDDGRGEQPEAVVAVAPAPKDAPVPPADAVAPEDVVEEAQDGAAAVEDAGVVGLSASATPGSVSMQKIGALTKVCPIHSALPVSHFPSPNVSSSRACKGGSPTSPHRG